MRMQDLKEQKDIRDSVFDLQEALVRLGKGGIKPEGATTLNNLTQAVHKLMKEMRIQ